MLVADRQMLPARPAGRAELESTRPEPVGRQQQLSHALQRVERLAAVTIPIGRDEHLRLDLSESIQHATQPEVWRAR